MIQEALQDPAPQIRMQAAAALVGRKESNVTALLLRAQQYVVSRAAT